MSKKSQWVSASEAVKCIQSGNRVMVPINCGLPEALVDAMIADKDRLRDVEVAGGMQVKYPWLAPGLEGSFTYRTWQCTPQVKNLLKKGIVKYIPMRQGDAPRLFSRKGLWPIDVALIHTTPPDKDGFLNFGVSMSHSVPTAMEARIVVAQVNEAMPWVIGDGQIHISQVDYLVRDTRPLIEYPPGGKIGEIERKIGRLASDLIPDGAVIEIGIGTIPDAIIQELRQRKNLRFFAMGVDSIADLAGAGAIAKGKTAQGLAPCTFTEMLGTRKLFDFMNRNPVVEGRHSLIDARKVGAIDGFVSILGAIETDIFGQVNAETIGGKQMSAIGGGFDFLDGAYFSAGGKSILALPSTNGDGTISRIVAQLPLGSAVTHPRHTVQYIVTEHGVADVRGKSLMERATALINIAHPKFRDDLKKFASEY